MHNCIGFLQEQMAKGISYNASYNACGFRSSFSKPNF